MPSVRAEIERLLNERTRLATQLRRSFLEAIDRAGPLVNLNRIADLIRGGNAAQAVAEVDSILQTHVWDYVASAAEHGMSAAGRSAARHAISAVARGIAGRGGPTVGRLEAVFSVTNPRAVNFLRSYRFNLIRELSKTSREAIGLTIRDGVEAGRNPRDVARDVRAHIGLTRRQTQAVLNYRRYLQEGDPAALERKLRDRRHDSSVGALLRGERKLSKDQIDTMVARYQARYLKYRSEAIARTESIRALNAGNLEAWRQAAEDGTIDGGGIRRKWVYTHDARTRESHREIPGLNPQGVALDQPFRTPLGPLMYPGDPNGLPENTIHCRCAQIIRYAA